MKKSKLILFTILIILFLFLDYVNFPLHLNLETSNINWDFWMDFFNILVIIFLFIFTYNKIDQKNIDREKNKEDISVLLLEDCYRECISYVNLLTEDTVNNHIVPKTDFNSTDTENTIASKLQQSPFFNESVIMDLAKDGQIDKNTIAGYFQVKRAYNKYINMRIILFDAPEVYNLLDAELRNAINRELSSLNKQ